MSNSFNIDFEEWSELASSDPEAFEHKRQVTVDQFICSFPPKRQRQLRQLQWRIDGVRRSAKTPLAACMRISSMLMDSVYGNGGLLELLEQTSALTQPHARLQPATALATPADSANILTFPGNRPRN